MSESTESISVDVTGTGPDELRAAALAAARSFWGPGPANYEFELGGIDASPCMTSGEGVILRWEASVTVRLKARSD